LTGDDEGRKPGFRFTVGTEVLSVRERERSLMIVMASARQREGGRAERA
jgi:hypothetical protein